MFYFISLCITVRLSNSMLNTEVIEKPFNFKKEGGMEGTFFSSESENLTLAYNPMGEI